MPIGDQVAQFIVSGLTTGSIYALIALGFCIIHNATGIVNFTQVDFITLGGLMMYTFLLGLGLPLPLAFVLAVITVTLAGGSGGAVGHPTGQVPRGHRPDIYYHRGFHPDARDL